MDLRTAKYIYLKDSAGELIGYIDEYNGERAVFVNVISIRTLIQDEYQWEKLEPLSCIAVDLTRPGTTWKIYEKDEEFFAEYFFAIL